MLRLERDRIDVTPVGRLLICNIAAVFDDYLKPRAQMMFSQAI